MEKSRASSIDQNQQNFNSYYDEIINQNQDYYDKIQNLDNIKSQKNENNFKISSNPKVNNQSEKEVTCVKKIEQSTKKQKSRLIINLSNNKVDYHNSISSIQMEQQDYVNITLKSEKIQNISQDDQLEEFNQSIQIQEQVVKESNKNQKPPQFDLKCQLLDIINQKIIQNQKSSCQLNQQIIMDFQNESKTIKSELEITPECIKQKMKESQLDIQVGQLVFDEWVQHDDERNKDSSVNNTFIAQKDVVNEFHSHDSNQTTLIHPTATCNLNILENQLQNQQSANDVNKYQEDSTNKISNSHIQIIKNKHVGSVYQHHHQNQKSMHLPIIPKQQIPNIYKRHQYAQSISGSLNNFKNNGYPFFQRSHTDLRVQKNDANNDNITISSHQSLNFENAIQPLIPLCEYDKLKEESDYKFIQIQKLNYQLEKENALLKQSLYQKELEDKSNNEREEIQKRQQEQMIKMYQDREDQQNHEHQQLQDNYHYLQQENQIQNDKLEQNHNTIQDLYRQLNELQEVLLIKDKEFEQLKLQLSSQMNQNKIADVELQKQQEMQQIIQQQNLQNQEILISKLKQENQMLALESQNRENQIQLQHMQILDQKIQQIQKKNEIEKEKAIKEALKPYNKDQALMQKLLSEKNDSIRELRQEKQQFDQKCNDYLKQINKQKRQQKATIIKYEHIIKSLNERISYLLNKKRNELIQHEGQSQLTVNEFKKQLNLNSLRGRSSTITECFDHQNLLGSDQLKGQCKHIKISGINFIKKANPSVEEISYRNGVNVKCVKLKIDNKKGLNLQESSQSRNELKINKDSIIQKQKLSQRPQSTTNKLKDTFISNNQELNLTSYLQKNKITRSFSRQNNQSKTQNFSHNFSQSYLRNNQNGIKIPINLQDYEGAKDNEFDVQLVDIRNNEQLKSDFDQEERQQIIQYENESIQQQNIYRNEKDEDRELAFDLTQTNMHSQDIRHQNLNEYNIDDLENKHNIDYHGHSSQVVDHQLSPQSNPYYQFFQNQNLNFQHQYNPQNYNDFKLQQFQQQVQIQQCVNQNMCNNTQYNNQIQLKNELNIMNSDGTQNQQEYMMRIGMDLYSDENQNKLQQTLGSEKYQLINFPSQNIEQNHINNFEILNQFQQNESKNYNHCECCKKLNQQCYKNYLQNFTNSLIIEKVNNDIYKETSNSFQIRKEVTNETDNGMIDIRNIEQGWSNDNQIQEVEKQQIKNNEQNPTYLISQLYLSSRTTKTLQTDGMQHTTNHSDLITGEYEIPKLNIQTDKLPLCSQRHENYEQLEIQQIDKLQNTSHHTKTPNIIANQDGQLYLISNQQNSQQLHILDKEYQDNNLKEVEIENYFIESESKQNQNLSHRLSYENQMV